MIYSPAYPVLQECSLSNNTARFAGGALWFSGTGSSLVLSSNFTKNHVMRRSAGGGGIAVLFNHSLQVNFSTFSQHPGTGSAGSAVYIDSASPSFVGCEFVENHAYRGTCFAQVDRPRHISLISLRRTM